MKEQRLNFSDYTAEEQEADVKSHQEKKPMRQAYLMRIHGEWAHFIVSQKCDDIGFYGDKNLGEVYRELKEKRPDFVPKVIQNEGLENYLKDVKAQREKKYGKQLKIDFNGNLK